MGNYQRHFYNTYIVIPDVTNIRHHKRMNTSLHNKIMRRIYYTFALRIVLQPTLLLGFLMLGMMIVLTYFVSIGNVIHNLLSLDAGNISEFVLRAFLHTEIWTLIVLGLLIFTAFSFRFTLAPYRRTLRLIEV